jgi:integrase
VAIHKLTTSRIAKLTANGMYGDGGNLWLQVTNNGAGKSWIFRWTERGTGRERNMGLGPLITVDLERARELAKGYRLMLLEGKDPKAERDNTRLDLAIAAGTARTVSQVAHEYFEAKIARKSDNWQDLTSRVLRTHVHDTIGTMPIEKVNANIILHKPGVGLAELWVRQFPTAEKVHNHLDRMFRFAIVQGYYHHENPAAWEKLQHVLPSRDDVYRIKHRESLPYGKVGQFLQKLRAYRYSPRGRGGAHIRFSPQALASGSARHTTVPYTLTEAAAACALSKSNVRRAISSGKIPGTKDEFGVWHVKPAELHRVFPPASCPAGDTAEPLLPFEQRPMITLLLECVILTGVRLGEARYAQWKEFDLTCMVWTVPWQHLKTGRKFRTDRPVPITKTVLAVVEEARRRRTNQSPDALVFPARHDGRPFKAANASTWINTSAFKWETKITVHGFRSTLRDWCRANRYPPEWWDIQADHVVGNGNKASQSYGPDKLLEERRGMMEAWDEYCSRPAPEPQSADVVKLSEKRKRRSA